MPRKATKTTALMEKQKEVTSLADILPIVQKLNQIEKELNEVFVEREEQIRDLLRGLVTGKHVLFLGPPGTGKSKLARSFAQHIVSANYFERLLNRTTDVSELLGPVSLKALEEDRFERIPKGKLPEAHVAFLDEIYKCNEPALNILLSILNEGLWYNNGKPERVNLRLLVAASNEGPEDETLMALHDRLVFRHKVNYITDAQNRLKMMQRALAERNGLAVKRTTVTLEEIDAVRSFVNRVQVPDTVLNALVRLVQNLQVEGVTISDRRLNIAVHVLQGEAVLNGRDVVQPNDLMALASVLWEEEEHIPLIRERLAQFVNPHQAEVKKILNEARELKDMIDQIQNKTQKIAAALDARQTIGRLAEKLKNMLADAQAHGDDTSVVKDALHELSKVENHILSEALGVQQKEKFKVVEEEGE